MKILLILFFLTQLLFSKPTNEDKKLLMIFVEMQHCQWCHKMREEIFDNPNVLDRLKKKFYVVKISKESGNLPLFVHPKYFPTTYLFSQDGTELIDSLAGYRTKEKFLKFFDTDYLIEDEEF
jgi:thioredoxin-related protein